MTMLQKSSFASLFVLASILMGCSTSGGTAPPVGAGTATVPNPAKAGPDPNLSASQNEAYKSMAGSRALMDQHYREQPMGPHK